MSESNSTALGPFVTRADRPQPAAPKPRQGWSWKIATIVGIPVRVHATFAFLLVWIAMSHVASGHGLLEIASGFLLVFSLFACVVLHELSHALTARRFGIQTRDILLLPIGGVARLERMPEKPGQELLVALAGPVASLAIAGVLFGVVALLGTPTALQQVHLVGGPFLTKLMWINVTLAVFNLLPAFPMDGGRVLRAALALRMERSQATLVAARIGQSLALGLGVIGFLWSPMLVLIAVFVWMGARGEVSVSQVKVALQGLPVSQAMITNFQVLSPDATLAHAVELTLAGFQRDFPVQDEHGIVGILTHGDLLKGLTEAGPQTRVDSVMQRRFEHADPSEMLEVALERLQKCDCRALIVMRSGDMVGLLTSDSIGELLTMEGALRA